MSSGMLGHTRTTCSECSTAWRLVSFVKVPWSFDLVKLSLADQVLFVATPSNVTCQHDTGLHLSLPRTYAYTPINDCYSLCRRLGQQGRLLRSDSGDTRPPTYNLCRLQFGYVLLSAPAMRIAKHCGMLRQYQRQVGVKID